MADYGKQCKVCSTQKGGLQKHSENRVSEMRKVRRDIETFVRCFNLGKEIIQAGQQVLS